MASKAALGSLNDVPMITTYIDQFASSSTAQPIIASGASDIQIFQRPTAMPGGIFGPLQLVAPSTTSSGVFKISQVNSGPSAASPLNPIAAVQVDIVGDPATNNASGLNIAIFPPGTQPAAVQLSAQNSSLTGENIAVVSKLNGTAILNSPLGLATVSSTGGAGFGASVSTTAAGAISMGIGASSVYSQAASTGGVFCNAPLIISHGRTPLLGDTAASQLLLGTSALSITGGGTACTINGSTAQTANKFIRISIGGALGWIPVFTTSPV